MHVNGFIFVVIHNLIMHINHKALSILAINLAFILSAGISYAQVTFSVGAGVKSNYVNHRAKMTMAGLSKTSDDGSYPYLVTLKDGTRETVKSKIYTDTKLHQCYLISEDKTVPKADSTRRYQKILPNQTKYIFRLDGDNGVGAGVARDSCWMFQVMTGSLNAYSYLSKQEGAGFDPSTIIGIQLNSGPIIQCNTDNLKQIIGSDANALKEFETGNYYNAMYLYNTDVAKANSDK